MSILRVRELASHFFNLKNKTKIVTASYLIKTFLHLCIAPKMIKLFFYVALVEKSTLWKKFDRQFERHSYMRVILFVNPTNLVTNSLLSVCFSFVKTKNKNQSFKNQNKNQVGDLVTKGSCLQGVVLYFKSMLNSLPFNKGIFLHIIPVRIIVPLSNSFFCNFSFSKINDTVLFR